MVVGGIAAAYTRKLRRQKELAQWTKEQEQSSHILPLPEERPDDRPKERDLDKKM